MQLSNRTTHKPLTHRVASRLKDFQQLFSLPRTKISLGSGLQANELYAWFTQPHAKLPLFANKTVGVQLLDLKAIDDFESYLKTINGKNSASYYRRKALSKGYAVKLIDRNDYIEDIHAVNLSLKERQGRRMHPMYLEKVAGYEDLPLWRYFGVIDANNTLRAYLNLQLAGDVAVVRTLLGHGEYLNDGIMYLLLIETARHLYELREQRYLMYDMYFGSGSGLRLFKRKLGFKPYWVKWRTQTTVAEKALLESDRHCPVRRRSATG